MWNKAGRILIAAGTLFILAAFGMKGYAAWKQDSFMKEYRVYAQAREQSSEHAETETEAPPEVEEGMVFGMIRIPDIEVETPLTEGIGSEDLKASAGHFPDTVMPGEIGNCAVAGHRSYTYGQCFNRLGELVGGEQIEMEADGKSYLYTVTDIQVVEPDNMEVLEPSENGVRELTLVTCTPVRSATHRLIIKAKMLQ